MSDKYQLPEWFWRLYKALQWRPWETRLDADYPLNTVPRYVHCVSLMGWRYLSSLFLLVMILFPLTGHYYHLLWVLPYFSIVIFSDWLAPKLLRRYQTRHSPSPTPDRRKALS